MHFGIHVIPQPLFQNWTIMTKSAVGSRANFAIASSFLMQLLVTSESEAESNEINDLVARWRWAMRIGSGSTGNGLMSLGLLRLDGLLLENGTVQTASG
jgi:hypothetical protein